MKTLQNICETASGIRNGLVRTVERSMTGLFGTSNTRYLKRLQPKLDAINALEPRCREFTTAKLKEQTDKFRKRLANLLRSPPPRPQNASYLLVPVASPDA